MNVRMGGAAVFLCLLNCLSASARVEASFSLDEALQKATHVVLLEAGDEGFRVSESWAGDLTPGAVLDCLDLYSVDSAQYARISDVARGMHADDPTQQGAQPAFVDGLVFIPEGASFVLFLREVREESGRVIPTAELPSDSERRFACVSNIPPGIVTSLVWSEGDTVYHFSSIWGEGPQRPEVLESRSAGEEGKRPSMKLEELKRLVTSRQVAGEPADVGVGTAEEVAWQTRAKREIKGCQFKDVVLRLFRGGDVSANGYERVIGRFFGTRIMLLTPSVAEDGALLCIPDDQTDPVVTEGLSNHVYLWSANREARLNPWDFSPASEMRAQVLDALGEPMPGARVSLALQRGYRDSATTPVPLCERMTDENGEVALLALPPGRDGDAAWHYAPLTVSHPQYGLTQVRWHGDSLNGDRTLSTSLLREGSEARDRAFRGVVVDHDMKPVAGATVTSESIRPPGLLINGQGSVVTDEAGRFCLYLPRRDWAGDPGKDTKMVPPHSEYAFSVTPPEGSGLRRAGGWASNSEPVTITLERESSFAARSSVHTFSFEGGFPEFTRPGASIQVAVRSDDAGYGVDLLVPDEERQIPYGTYYARIERGNAGSETRHFMPLVVNSESPKELIFREIQGRCAGQVVNGVTGESMPGVLCLVGARSWIPLYPLSDDLPDGLREALPGQVVAQSDVERLGELLEDDFPLLTAVVTDEQGRYEATAPSGRGIRLVYAIAEGYVPAARHVYSGNPSSDNRFDLDPIPLYPAGHAEVRIAGDGAKGQCRATWQVQEAATADWAVPLTGYEDRTRHSLEIMTGRFGAGLPDGTFLIPAMAPIHMTIHPPDAGLVPVHVPETVRVEPGQAVDLGKVRFAKAYNIPAVVRVVDEQGNPLEGVPIRKFAGNCWSSPCLTDANGVAKFDVSPGITEKVGMSFDGVDLSFAVALDLDEAAQVEHAFKVTAEQLNRLFGYEGIH